MLSNPSNSSPLDEDLLLRDGGATRAFPGESLFRALPLRGGRPRRPAKILAGGPGTPISRRDHGLGREQEDARASEGPGLRSFVSLNQRAVPTRQTVGATFPQAHQRPSWRPLFPPCQFLS